MAYATLEDTTLSTNTSSGNTLTVTLPATIVSGQLLVASVVCDNKHNGLSWPAGWTEILDYSTGNHVNWGIATRTADGTEGSSISVTVGTDRDFTCQVKRYSGWSAVTFSSNTLGDSTSPNPPSVTAAGGAGDNLFHAVIGVRKGSVSVVPSGYGGETANGFTGAFDTSLSISTKQSTAASDDPGTATSTDERWGCVTYVVEPVAGGTNTNVALAAGGFTLTGNALATDLSSALAAGSFALTGYGPTATVTTPVALDAGNLSLSGFDLTANIASNIALDAGAYTLTGPTLGVALDRPVALAAGTYGLTGFDLGISLDRSVALDAGTFTLAGLDLGATVSYQAPLDAGAFTATGYALGVSTANDTPVALVAGTYTVSGLALGVDIARHVALGAGSFSLAGFDATLTQATPVGLDAGSFTVAGLGLTLDQASGLDSGSFTVAGYSLGVTADRAIALDAGGFGLSGNELGLALERPIALDAGTYTLSGFEPSLTFGLVVVRLGAPDLADGRLTADLDGQLTAEFADSNRMLSASLDRQVSADFAIGAPSASF